MINKVSDETKQIIKGKSVAVMPDRPSERGYKAVDIKQALIMPLIDASGSVVSEINRIVDEINGSPIACEKSTDMSVVDDNHIPTTKAVVDYAVPFRLSTLEEAVPTSTGFRTASVYVDHNGTGFRMSVQQIKDLNTKIIATDTLDASGLDVGDYIHLNQNNNEV